MTRVLTVVIGFTFILLPGRAGAQHLWWDTRKLDNAFCLYGEITVLATHDGIYYCGANWHPGEPAGGYCGIQHNGPTERRTIFSIWDTSSNLPPRVTQAAPETIFNRFGGEGEGSHTHMLWNWEIGDTFQFFLKKQPGSTPGTTDARYYIYDRKSKKWRHSATISSPNGDNKSKASVMNVGGGGLVSFLENFVGQDRTVPKLALYRLWLGTSVDNMQCLTHAQGDGTWGQLGNAYFLAEGESKELDALFGKLQKLRRAHPGRCASKITLASSGSLVQSDANSASHDAYTASYDAGNRRLANVGNTSRFDKLRTSLTLHFGP